MSVRTGQVFAPLLERAAPLLLMALGVATLLVMGFAQGELIHEFVHDARHLIGAPCH